jgi:parvulin-like peptidyl-prolyl isomerase
VIFRRIALSAIAVVSLASCGVVPSANDAFSVEETSWSREKFNDFLAELINAQQITTASGGANAEDARGVATVLIRQEATDAFLASQGESITQADRDALLADLTEADPFYTYSETLQDVLLQINGSRAALSRVEMPSAGELKDLYNVLPARAGVLCISHIVVTTRKEANTALRRLKNGEDFATVAREMSIEPAALQTGGALTNQTDNNPCFTLEGIRQEGFDPQFVAGAMSARAGILSGPVKSSFGYHVILNAPWNDVADAVTALVETSPGNVLNEGYLVSADIEVASSIGRWNIVNGSIE